MLFIGNSLAEKTGWQSISGSRACEERWLVFDVI